MKHRSDISHLILSETYENVWAKVNNWDEYARRATNRLLTVAIHIPFVYEVNGNHFLDWEKYIGRFPCICFTNSLEIDGWRVEHGYRLDPYFQLQQPWYSLAGYFHRWYFKTPFQEKLRENENYPRHVEWIRTNYKQWASEEGNPKKVIIFHTHSQDWSSNALTGVEVVNLASLAEDGVFAILEDGKLEIRQL